MVSYRSVPGDIGGYQMLYSRLGPRERMMTELKSVAITIHIGNPSPELKGEWCLQKLAKRGGCEILYENRRFGPKRWDACFFLLL